MDNLREFKLLILLVLGLTYLGGLGAGAWVGTLTAAPRMRAASVDRRLGDFTEHFDLNPSQVRQLRAVLFRYDKAVDEIRSRLTAREMREKLALERASREAIRTILDDSQRTDYDKLIGGK